MVYGSNMIERAGSDFGITFKLCMEVFHGEAMPEETGEGDEDYIILDRASRARTSLQAPQLSYKVGGRWCNTRKRRCT